MSSLEERLEAGLAPAWRPDKEDPDLIVGTVIEGTIGNNEYGSYPIITVELEDGSGQKAIHGMQTVLRNELIRQQPKPGERIGVKYLGEQPTKPGSKFKSYTGYRVKVDRPTGIDWTKLGGDGPETEAYAAEAAAAAAEAPDAGPDDIPF